MINLNLFIILLGICLLSIVGTIFYRSFAIKHSILSNLNFRTLHQKPTPRGGGVIFSMIFALSVILFSSLNIIEKHLINVFGYGSILALLLGYIDDLIGISSLKKLLLQFFLVFWILYFFSLTIFTQNEVFSLAFWLVVPITLVWLINAYNFIDGVDGMAILGAILISSTIILTLIFTSGFSDLMLLLLALLASCLGFLFFNWPKASIFMGDSGSIFLGFCFSSLIVFSVTTNQVSIFTWLVVFGYYLGDTSTTTILRIFLVKKWYGSHRSHAYQNLARIKDNHFLVTSGVLIYHLFWLLPLAILTVFKQNMVLIIVICAYLPSILWTIRFGPLLSRE